MRGKLEITKAADQIFDDRPERSKALVPAALTALLQRHDPSAVEQLYPPGCVQHHPDVARGRNALSSVGISIFDPLERKRQAPRDAG
ncbi:hypothetical protein [Bradyrhizobium sp. 195]|uniref:hypothetical protein n=1 Tax=Bradyrhizobium sp. 195 TaxID=2782662 RepID=UPI002001C2DD|nr:hypothetical protein [Bradyrhizobium sp. 195]UPK25456.1 hypothetical protein IVB26_29670 [Bradyrhizobium sp. 195]